MNISPFTNYQDQYQAQQQQKMAEVSSFPQAGVAMHQELRLAQPDRKKVVDFLAQCMEQRGSHPDLNWGELQRPIIEKYGMAGFKRIKEEAWASQKK